MPTTVGNVPPDILVTPATAPHASRRGDDAPKPPPAYRRRKGYEQAIVTFIDAHTKKRRDYWLGSHGSLESRELC